MDAEARATASPALPHPAHRAGDTVLIVDNEPSLVDLYRDLFTAQGYRVLTALSGAEGIIVARAAHPDLILLDVMMPGVSGIDVCQALRQRLETARIPIIFVTAAGSASDRVRGLNAGADDYLTKPFDLGELLARVVAVLRRVQPPEATDRGP